MYEQRPRQQSQRNSPVCCCSSATVSSYEPRLFATARHFRPNPKCWCQTSYSFSWIMSLLASSTWCAWTLWVALWAASSAQSYRWQKSRKANKVSLTDTSAEALQSVLIQRRDLKPGFNHWVTLSKRRFFKEINTELSLGFHMMDQIKLFD